VIWLSERNSLRTYGLALSLEQLTLGLIPVAVLQVRIHRASIQSVQAFQGHIRRNPEVAVACLAPGVRCDCPFPSLFLTTVSLG